MTEPYLIIEKLSARLPTPKGDIFVVNDVSFSIFPSEIIVLLGESGCGKSSLLLTALGLFEKKNRLEMAKVTRDSFATTKDIVTKDRWDTAVSGHSFYRGVDLLSLTEVERTMYWGRHIGFVPQGLRGSLDPMFDIGEQTGESLEIHEAADMRRAEMQKKVIEYLNLVSLAEAKRRMSSYRDEFSGGESQRIVIAGALISAPYILFADEPTSALDVSIKAQILNVLRMVRDEFDVSLLIATHDASIAAEIADRVAVMYAGRIVEIGTAVDMFKDPRHPYTKGLMASIPTITMMKSKEGTKPKIRGIRGSPADLSDLPKGCAFHPRCDYAQDICVAEIPQYREVKDGHFICCHRYEEIA